MNGTNNLDLVVYGYYSSTPALADSISFPQTFTTESDSQYIVFGFNKANITSGDVNALKLQLEIGNQQTSFAPYENICPITGRNEIGILGCGKNLIEEIEQGSWNTSWGTKTNSNIRCRSTKMYDLSPSQYTLSVESNVSGKTPLIVVQEYTYSDGRYTNTFDSGWQSSGYSFTTIQGRFYTFLFSFDGNPEVTPSSFKNVQLEKTSSPTAYSPYTESNNLTIQFGQTVYGGTLDVKRGVLTVDRGYDTVGNLNWTYVSASQVFYTSDITDEKKAEDKTVISSVYQSLDNVTSAAGVSQDASICAYRGTDSNHRIYIKDTRYNDASAFKTAMGDAQICYKLATPTEIQLTPHQISLLEGVNNISVDDSGTSISLTYRDGSVATLGDVKVVKDSLEQEIADSQILTDTVTGDKYKLVITNGVLNIQQVSN